MQKITLDEVLYFYNFPLLFSFEMDGALYLGSVIDERDASTIFIAAPTYAKELNSIKNNEFPLRDVLEKSILEIEVDSTFNFSIISMRAIDFVPDHYLPEPNVYLYSSK